MKESIKCGQCDHWNEVSKQALTHKCRNCGTLMWREPEDINPTLQANQQSNPLAEFDDALATITQRRGATYGHPGDDFAMAVAMKERLPHWEDRRLRHIAEMICVKLARLAATPTHVDSLVDIAGYARTWAMILERDYRGAQPGKDPAP